MTNQKNRENLAEAKKYLGVIEKWHEKHKKEKYCRMRMTDVAALIILVKEYIKLAETFEDSYIRHKE